MGTHVQNLLACGRSHGRFTANSKDFILVGSSEHLEPLSIEQYKEWELLMNSDTIIQWQEKSSLSKDKQSFEEGIEFLLSSGFAIDLNNQSVFNTFIVSRNGTGVGLVDGDKWRITTKTEENIHLSKEQYLVWVSASGNITINQVITNIQRFFSCEKNVAEKMFISFVRVFVKTSLWVIEKYVDSPSMPSAHRSFISQDYDDDCVLLPLGQTVGYLENIKGLESGLYTCTRNSFISLSAEQYLFWLSLFNGEITVEQACNVLGYEKDQFKLKILNPIVAGGLVLPYKTETDLESTKFFKGGLALRASKRHLFMFKTLIISEKIKVPDVCHKVWSMIGLFDSFNLVVQKVAENFEISFEEANRVVSTSVIILMQKGLLTMEV